MPEQHLNRAQIGARFQQMSRPAMAQRVRSNALADARVSRCFRAGVPDGLSDMGWSLPRCPSLLGNR